MFGKTSNVIKTLSVMHRARLIIAWGLACTCCLATAGYNKIIVSDSGLFWERTIWSINTSVPEKMSPIILKDAPMPKVAYTSASRHEEERVALLLTLASAFGI